MRQNTPEHSVLKQPMSEIAENLAGWLGALAEVPAQTAYQFMLECQHELTIAHVLQTLTADTGWQTASDVLDLGCGCGQLLGTLSKTAPDKHYLGVDQDQELITQASLNAPGVTFVCADFMSQAGHARYDYVFLIEVVKHLPDLKALESHLLAALRPGGTVFVREALQDRWLSTSPSVPGFTELQQMMFSHQKAQRLNPSDVDELERRFRGDSWQLQSAQDVPLRLSEQQQLDTVFRLMMCTAELSVRFYGFAVDRLRLAQELMSWLSGSAATAWMEDRWLLARAIR